jgi:metallo-beta-lactamase class B
MRFRLIVAALYAATAAVGAQTPAPVTPESLVAAAKRAAGQDYAGTFLRICVAPENLGAGRAGGAGRGAANAPASRTIPDRATWHAQPYKVFDNLFFIGTRIHSAWALTTSEGIIVIDTLFDYAIEPEMVEGLTKLGLNPRDIKYVLISHAHGDHDQGAALLQNRYGAKVVMGAADWDSTLQRPATAAGGVPKRDTAVGLEGRKITLGDTTVDVIATPGHTPGTLSLFFTG